MPSELAQLPSPVRQQFPERWFESAVRANLPKIDPALSPAPVHGQVLSFAAGDRGLIDLLAASPGGRLAVLELKTSEDIHLPLQALDYWMRVAWHAQRDELSHLFPGIVAAKSRAEIASDCAGAGVSFLDSHAATLFFAGNRCGAHWDQ